MNIGALQNDSGLHFEGRWVYISNMMKLPILLLFALIYIFPCLARASCVGLGCECTISVTSVNFGTYAPLDGSTVDTTGTVTVTCSALIVDAFVSYVVELSTGNSGNYTTRQMSNGSMTINYNLYTDSNYTQIWGNGSAGTSVIANSYIISLFQQTDYYTVYGHIPASQNVSAGIYNDSIVATIKS